MTAVAIDTTTDSSKEIKAETVEAMQFSFRCGNRLFSAWTQPADTGFEVCVACELGHLPYSAESPERRRNGLMILSAAGAAVSARLLLTDFHKISLLASVTVDDIADSKTVVSGAAVSVLSMLPLIELMESCVVPAPSAA